MVGEVEFVSSGEHCIFRNAEQLLGYLGLSHEVEVPVDGPVKAAMTHGSLKGTK
ncbi:MAG: hypothetical protein NVSMB4_09570 [Acidimicrobiales bacterium]